MAGQSSSGAAARDVKMKISWVINSNPLAQANKQVDESISATKKLSDATDRAKKSQDEFGNSTQRSGNEQRQNSQQTQTATDKMKQLNQQLDLSKSALRAQTAGLSDMGREAEATKIKASALSNIFDLQRQKVALLNQKYADMKSSTNASADAMATMRVRINEETAALGTLQGKLAVTNNSFKNASDKYKNIGDNMRSAGSGMTSSMGMATMAVGGGLLYVSKQAADFQQEMSNVKSVMDPADVQKYSGALEKLAIVQGAKTKYSATEAAQAEGELVKAGVSVSDIMNGALAGSLNLATAGELNLKDAAEIASTALNSFRNDHLSVAKAADILAGAANASATDVGEMKFSLSAVSAVAAGVGLSFKDTSTALAVFAQNGLKGQDAGTSLKTMLANLHPMTNTAAQEFDRLGLLTFNASAAMATLRKNGVQPLSSDQGKLMQQLDQLSIKMSGAKEGSKAQQKAYSELTSQTGVLHSAFYDSNGQLKNMSEIASILQDHLHGLNGEQRQAALYTMFGSDAIRGANILYREGAKGVTDMASAMDKIKASDVAAQKMNNLKGSIEQLNGSVQTASISLGNGLIPAFNWATAKIQGFVDGFNKLSPAMQHTVAIGGLLVAGAMGIATAIGIGLSLVGGAIRGYSDIVRVLSRMTGGTAESTVALKMQRDEMVKNTVAAEAMAKAENDAANAGGIGGGIGGKTKGAAKGAATAAEAVQTADTVATVAKDTKGGARLLGTVGKVGKVAAGGVVGLDVLTSMTGLIGMTKDTAGSHVGDAAGSLTGTVVGGAIGTAIAPGIGTAVGAALGSWLGSEGGKYIGNQIQHPSAQNKITAGDVTLMNAGYRMPIAVRNTSDPSLQMSKNVKSLVSDYNSASKSIDNQLKNIAATGSTYSKQSAQGVNNAYKSIVQSAKSAVSAQESATRSHFNMLVKDGLMSASAASQAEKTQSRQYKANISLAQDAAKQLQSLNNSYYAKMKSVTNKEESEISAVKKKYTDKNGVISQTGENKIAQIEQKYADQRRKISNQYSSKRIALEKALKSDVAGVLSASSAQQKIILGKLRDDSGYLSKQQASSIVQQAKKARDGAISAANDKYKNVMKAADQEYYVTGSISKSQYESIKKKADQQRDDAVKAANDQWHGTVNAAKQQAKGHVDQINWETGKVLGFWDRMGNGIAGTWNGLVKAITGKDGDITFNAGTSGGAAVKSVTHSTNTHGMAYAAGTPYHPGGNMILGDGGKPELWITPQGKAGISPAIPTMYRNMPVGTQVLNGTETEKALSMKAYANGTSGFWSSIGSFLGKGFDWLKGGAVSATNWAFNKLGLANVGNIGDLTRFTRDIGVPAVKKLFSSAVSNLGKWFGNIGNPSGAGVQRWAPYVVKALQMNGLSTSAGMVAKVLRQIATESGGNPNAIQHGYTDVNSISGNLARGLMQVIPQTFKSFAFPGHYNSMNGFDSLLAGLNYAKHRYGPSLSFLGQGHGYENGGISMTDKMAHISEGNKPEAIVPITKPSRALQVINRAKQMMGIGGERQLGGQPANVTFSPTVNINVDGSKGDISEEKLARLVRQELEKVMKNLMTTFDPGVVI